MARGGYDRRFIRRFLSQIMFGTVTATFLYYDTRQRLSLDQDSGFYGNRKGSTGIRPVL